MALSDRRNRWPEGFQLTDVGPGVISSSEERPQEQVDEERPTTSATAKAPAMIAAILPAFVGGLRPHCAPP